MVCIVGVANAKTEKVHATFAAPSNTSAIWNAADSSFTWKQTSYNQIRNKTSYNQIRNIGLPTGDITMYKKLVVDCEVREGSTFRILVYKGGSNLTLWAKDGVNEFILADTLKTLAPDDYNSYLKECSEICLSGSNAVATGEVKINNSIYLETYPENESVEIPDVQYEEDPGKPAGDFVDFTEAFPDLQPRIGLGADEHPIELGNGDVVVGQRTKNVIADLSAYSKLTIVTSPNLKLVLYMNHEIDAKQNAGEYTEDEAGKYVFMDVQANENGIIEVDLTQFEKQDLNAICLPWDNSNKGTVWYLLLTKGEAAPVAQEVTFDFTASNHAVSSGSGASYDAAGEITADEVNTVDGVVMTISPADEGANTPNRYWKYQDAPQLRMYSGKMTIEAPEGKAITKIEIEKGSKWSADNTFNGESAAEATWEGNSTNVILAVADNSQMNKVIVTLADKNEETTTYKEPVKPVIAEGTYYLYNVGGAGYLVGANSWGTRASISKVGGLEVEAVMTPEGKYELKTASLYAGKHLGFNGYVDNGDESNWTITPVEGQEGVYTLTSTGTNVLFWDGGEATTTSVGAMPETAVNAYWKIISSADRLAQLATASAENPVDATFLISNPNFGRNASNAAWTMDASNQNLSGGTDDNRCAESFHAIFTLSQVLAKAPAGKYELKAQGFYRQDDGVEEDLPVFYANDKSGAFPAKTGAENSMNDASASFTKGEYTIEPFQFSVFEDGQLTIGAKGTATHQWVIFDNFQLTYLTSEIPADEFKPAYEEALAAAQAALANETYASVTGDEKAALEKAIADNTTVEETMAAYKAAISALNAATSAFTGAKADYEALATAKTGMKDLSYQYAAADKKAAAEATLAVEATSAADAKAKAAAIEKAYRQYAESSALLEGVEGSKNMTEAITNPNAQEAIADPWAVVLGEGSGGSLGILDGEPLTDGEGNSAYKYFDGGNWGAQAWDVSLQQKIALPAGKYQLTVSGRASADVDLQLFAGEATAKLASIGATGGLFGRGWGDASVEFELAEADSVLIGVRGVTEKQHNWMSFTRFRLMQFAEPAEVAHTWNFTKWSEETVTNLKAEAVKVTVVDDPDNAGKTLCTDNDAQWSDHEKKPGTACETYAASKDNCFWSITTPDENGELAANGVTIAELKGLSFNSTYSAGRSLAIAVNYPSTSLGTYNGPAYLWFGGKNQEILTIKNVKAGSLISIGVESHNITKARGVKLLVGETELTDPEGNAVAVPTTYVEQTWAVPAGEGVVDVVVKNTDGCHIYFIDAEIGEAAPEVVPDDPEPAVADGWVSVITNGNLAGDEVVNFFTKENSGDPIPAVITAGAGKDGSRGIVINTPDAPSTDWDAQFFIQANENIPAGAKIHVEFDYMATQEAGFDTQSHAVPGDYIWWYCVGSETANTEWKHFSAEVEVSAGKLNDNGGIDGEYGKACDGSEGGKPFQTVAFHRLLGILS